MNPTAVKFGYPDTLLHAYRHWLALLRPAQATLGALVLVCTEPARSFGTVSAEALAELGQAASDIETALTRAFAYDKINYLMLMMIDPDVHFHVLPRYGQTRQFAGLDFADAGWPGPPRLDTATATDAEHNRTIAEAIRSHWP